MTPHITIIHPSRSRPEMAIYTYARWKGMSSNPSNIEYLMSIDNSDPYIDEYMEWYPCALIGNNSSAIEAINVAAEQAKGNLLIVVSDDFDCPMHWDKLLLDALEGKEDFVVKTDDGAQPWIITLPIMDRKYYHRFGYVYNPDYKHMFADTEMTHVGAMLGKTINLPIKFEHRHYTTGAMQKDAINEKNDATWNQGEALYLERLKRNFDLDPKEIVNPASVCHHTHKEWLKSKGMML